MRGLYYSWNKKILKNIEEAIKCNLECSYIVLFRVVISNKKVQEIDYGNYMGLNSPLLVGWWLDAKYSKHQSIIDVEDFIKSVK